MNADGPASLRSAWALDPAVTFLNHGSFGACPRPVLDRQAELRSRMEANPVRFMDRDLADLLDRALDGLAAELGADADDLVFVTNATGGVSAVLRSLEFSPGDDLLITDHAYPACRYALDHVASHRGAKVVVAEVPFPITSPDQVVEAVLAAVTPRTVLALLDHVTSPTALIFPIERLVAELAERDVETLVDGAHAPGMVPVDLTGLGAAYVTGNCHKWMCAPKGAAYLYVRPDLRERILPLALSHGITAPASDPRVLRRRFDWTGTNDPTASLCVPAAIAFVGGLLPGGWDEVRAVNHALVLAGRRLVCAALEVDEPAPDTMVGSMAAVPLPDLAQPLEPGRRDPLQDALAGDHRIEVPVVAWPDRRRRLLRISAHLYNQRSDYERLAEVLRAMLDAGR